MRRRLCKRCYGKAIERKQTKVAPLPGTVVLSTMTRVTASVGRCGLAPAAWISDAGRLCDVCYRRKRRRALDIGLGPVPVRTRRSSFQIRVEYQVLSLPISNIIDTLMPVHAKMMGITFGVLSPCSMSNP